MKNKGLSFERKQKLIGYFFLFPVILGIVLIFLPNLIQTFRFSLNDIEIVAGQGYELNWKGIKYYKDALTVDAGFIPTMIASYKTMAINVPVIVIFSMLIASMLNQDFKGRAVARAIFFLPVILSTGVLLSVESGIMSSVTSAGVDTGSSLDGMLSFNLDELLVGLNFNKTLIGIVESAVKNIYNILISSGIQIYIFLAGIQEIPGALYEAAEVEGCSKWESFWKITFPMLMPQMMVNIIYTLVIEGESSRVMAYANNIGESLGNYGLANSMAIIYLFTLLIVIGLLFFMFGKLSMLSDSESVGGKA